MLPNGVSTHMEFCLKYYVHISNDIYCSSAHIGVRAHIECYLTGVRAHIDYYYTGVRTNIECYLL
jgi:5-formaminoimidazole-4-carboxamide-1-beta-D-ribofuranosyl 5'-monophosphate synthetase